MVKQPPYIMRDLNHRYAHIFVAENLEYQDTIPSYDIVMIYLYRSLHNTFYKLW